MKHFLLTRTGALEYRTGKATWAQMNGFWGHSCSKEDHEFLKRYGQRPTIFNIANLQKCDEVPLPPYYARLAIDNGAQAADSVKETLNQELKKRGYRRTV